MSIWDFKEIKKNVNATEYITLNEGNTPVNTIEDSTHKIYLKREDLNPTGSWKDRATAFKLTMLLSKNINEAVITSSGNAAISFIEYLKDFNNFKLRIVVEPFTSSEKVELIQQKIKNTNHELIIKKNSKKTALQISLKNKIPNIRSATDNEIVKAYWSLGFEIYNQILKKSRAESCIICPVSSGTAFVGMVQGLFYKLEKEEKMPKLIICQTQSCHPLDPTYTGDESPSLAGSIIAKPVLRKPQIMKAINQTNGKVLTITNTELIAAKEYAQNKGFDLSYTSLLSIAGFLKLKDSEKIINYICINSGR